MKNTITSIDYSMHTDFFVRADSFMSTALEEAKLAYERESVPVGAVIVEDGKILARAGNEVMKNFDVTSHAEILAIKRASSIKKTRFLDSCDMYVTLEPCAMCAQAISFARIRHLFFGAYDIKGGGVVHGAQIFKFSLHKPEVIGGVLESACSEILKVFFEVKR